MVSTPAEMNQPWTKVLPQFIWVRLEGRPNLRTILSNTGWLFADRLLRMGVGLFVTVWVARYLGPDQFGLYSYAIAFVALFGAFATLGLDGVVVRDIVRDPFCKDETLGTVFALKLSGGLVTFALTVGIISLLRPGNYLTFWLVGITAAGLVFQAFDAIDLWFQSQVQSKYTVYAKNAAFLVLALVKVVLILAGARLVAFAWAGLAETALGGLGLVIAYRAGRNHFGAWRVSLRRAWALLSTSWPLILSGVSIMIYMRFDQIMLGEMIGESAVGVYSAAVRLSEIWYFVPIAIVSSVFPTVVQTKTISEALYHDRLQKLLSFMALLGYTVAIPTSLFSVQLVAILFGEAFAEAATSLAILVWSGLFVCLGVAQGSWMITEGLTAFLFVQTAIGAAANVGLNLFLIPLLGVTGAALATLIAQFVAVSLSTLFYQKTRRIFWMQIEALFFVKLVT